MKGLVQSALVGLAFVGASLQAPVAEPEPHQEQPQETLQQRDAAKFHRKPLVFSKDGTFQVSIFEDLHFGENYWDTWGPQQDINTVKVINEILDKENPGLVVLNGDLITGENSFKENATVVLDKIVAPIIERGLTWASTYGNHDSDFNLSRSDILAREQRSPNCRTRNMVKDPNAGVSNYYLPVFAPECSTCGCAPELLLWFFDSRGGQLYQQKTADGKRVGQPDWVDVSVVTWFQKENARIVAKYGGKVIPSLAFVHIPTYASLALQTENGRDSIDPNLEPGINDDYTLAPQAQGWCADGRNDGTCDYGGQDIPFMQALTTTPGLLGLFSGHDHGATWCYKWDHLVKGMTVTGNGLNLCFGQHTGYGGYGNWIRGARQVKVNRETLKSKWEADSWIRLESGAVVGSVSLNSTYGHDKYPATPNDKTYCPTCNYSVVSPGPPGNSFAKQGAQAQAAPAEQANVVPVKEQEEMNHGEWLASQQASQQ